MNKEVTPARFDELIHLTWPAKRTAYKLNKEIRKLYEQGIRPGLSVRKNDPLSPYGAPVVDIELSKPDGTLYE